MSDARAAPTNDRKAKLMIACAVVGLPASVCMFFAWPVTMLAVMVAFDLEPSGEWDAATIAANVLNLIVMGGTAICALASPTIGFFGVLRLLRKPSPSP